jgi:hypothetical protein
MRILFCFVLIFTLASAQDRTHLGVAARDLVVLELVTGVRDGCGPAKIDFVRSFPDGTQSADVFRIPDERVLVVTDLDWYFFQGQPGTTQVLRVNVENLADASKKRRAFESTIRLNSDAAGGASEHMTTGFAVSSKARVCLEILSGPIGPPLRISKVLMRGYLVDDR